ncbi:MAG: S-layer homology domain-containing protein [Oscillospiraceae bacterium]|nr:S-layer homology domain-containing protein [Oscillospiraceae bacterium]
MTGGTSATTFSPDDPCTRAQMVTFPYRYFVK